MLERGGNAVDAALVAAAVLCVTEPMSTGIGGDAFALVWDGERLHGLDAAGPAPRGATPVGPVEELGPRSVTVPGAVAGWDALADRFARNGLDVHLAEAISVGEGGFAVKRFLLWSLGIDTTGAQIASQVALLTTDSTYARRLMRL